MCLPELTADEIVEAGYAGNGERASRLPWASVAVPLNSACPRAIDCRVSLVDPLPGFVSHASNSSNTVLPGAGKDAGSS